VPYTAGFHVLDFSILAILAILAVRLVFLRVSAPW
jgi:hypothetical protein